MMHRKLVRGFGALVALTAVVALLAPLAGPALYKSEGSIAAILAASPVDVDAESMRQYQPASVFILPAPPIIASRQHTPMPPDKPPASRTQHPADFPVHPLDAA